LKVTTLVIVFMVLVLTVVLSNDGK